MDIKITEGNLGNLFPRDIDPEGRDFPKRVFEVPQRKTYTTLTFKLEKHGGEELRAGEKFIFKIPSDYSKRAIKDIIVKHRKDPSRVVGGDWDPDGAYSRVLVKDSQTKDWTGWVDPMGYSSDKYAEPRSAYDPEDEVLHDWPGTVGEVCPEIVSLENVGETERAIANIHGLEIIFLPEKKDVVYSEQIFSRGTRFIDIKRGLRLPSYGGGVEYGGTYPNALEIRSSYGFRDEPLNAIAKKDYYFLAGNLHIKLRPGKKLLSLEIAVGDTHPDRTQNKDGHLGTLGWAKIYAGLIIPGGNIRYFMEHVNVPPQGILTGGPEIADSLVQEGEEIVIESRADTSYLMGYRLSYSGK